MPYENLIVEIGDDRVATVTLNRPEQLNTFSWELAQELQQVLEELDGAPEVRVIMITGAGRAFCAGIDLTGYAGKTEEEYLAWIAHMEKPLLTISQISKPVLAKVNGVAAAIGAGLVAASDLAIATDKSRIGLTAIKVGLNCVGPVIPVARSVGRKVALEMLLSGDLFDARRAMEVGLYNRVTTPEELDSQAAQWAASLAEMSPVAMANAKQALYESEDLEYAAQFAHMNKAFAQLCTTPEAREGVAAFLEKREPSWKGK